MLLKKLLKRLNKANFFMEQDLSHLSLGELEELLEKSRQVLSCWEDETFKKEVISSLERFFASRKEGSALFYAKELSSKINTVSSSAQFQVFLVPLEREISRLRHKESFGVEEGDKEIPTSKKDLPGLYFVLDHLRSAYNVGSLLRLADCVGASVILTGYTPGADHPKVSKSAMGTEKTVPVFSFEKTSEALSFLKEKGVSVFALETVSEAQNLFLLDSSKKGPFALLVGNERHGVSYDVLAACDGILRIPVWGVKNSLNVSSALSIAAYEFRRVAGEARHPEA